MKSRRWHPSRCKVCGKTVDEVGRISATGLCDEHGRERMNENHDQLREHSGDHFDHWLERLRASVGALPVDSDSGAG